MLLGHFNPLIFRPEWFVSHGIISQGEGDEAKIGIIHPEIVMFDLPWLNFSVERERFRAVVNQEPIVRVHDLVVRCFSYLQETPITKLGINRELHFPTTDEAQWHKFGDLLAPKEPWGDVAFKDGKRRAGMRSLTMQEIKDASQFRGSVNVKVEPSARLKYGIFIDVNDHYDLEVDDKPVDARKAMDLIRDRWEPSISAGEEVADHLIRLT